MFPENAHSCQLLQNEKGKRMHALIGAVVFGSDQGLVGQFNDIVADYAVKELASFAR